MRASFSAVRGIGYRFTTREELRLLLEASEDRELDICCGASLPEGEWLVVTCDVANERVTVAGRTRDRGDGTRIGFALRDWLRLAALSGCSELGECRESIPPHSSEFRVRPPAASRVLVVDGDRDVRDMVCAVVRCSGFSSHAVDSAEEALDALRRQQFELIVVEQELRGMGGLEFCRSLRERSFTTPTLLLVNDASVRDAERFAAAAVSDYLAKPFRAPELWARMLSQLEISGLDMCG